MFQQQQYPHTMLQTHSHILIRYWNHINISTRCCNHNPAAAALQIPNLRMIVKSLKSLIVQINQLRGGWGGWILKFEIGTGGFNGGRIIAALYQMMNIVFNINAVCMIVLNTCVFNIK